MAAKKEKKTAKGAGKKSSGNARKTKAPRTAKNPAWQEVLEASDAQDGPEAEA